VGHDLEDPRFELNADSGRETGGVAAPSEQWASVEGGEAAVEERHDPTASVI
jgi:hypothetical protein